MKNGEKCYSTCGELFNYDTPDFDIGDSYYEGEIVVIKPSELVDDSVVDFILERMDEELYERCYVASEGALKLSGDDKITLYNMIKVFMDNHAEVSCYAVENIIEKVME